MIIKILDFYEFIFIINKGELIKGSLALFGISGASVGSYYAHSNLSSISIVEDNVSKEYNPLRITWKPKKLTGNVNKSRNNKKRLFFEFNIIGMF